MSSERKHHTPEEEVTILRRHLVDRVPVSTLCDEYRLHPTAFYRWLKQFFENGGSGASEQRRSTLPLPPMPSLRTIDPYPLKIPAAKRRNIIAYRKRRLSISR